MPREERRPARWTFVTNHGHVLICLAQSPELRLRDVALLVGVTERAVQRIVAELEEGGYLPGAARGGKTSTEIAQDKLMRHPVEAHKPVGALIAMAEHRPRVAGGRTRRVRR